MIDSLAQSLQAAMPGQLDFSDAVCAACAFACIPCAILVSWLMSLD